MGRPRAYEGTEPYVFVSYSHRDEARVWPMIEGLQSRGVRVWYDGGIEAGSHWDDEIFRHLDGSSHILAFVTENFLGSENCMDEIHFAKENQKGPMLLYLDRLELPKKLQYRYGRLQALIEPQFDSTDDFLDALSQTKIIAGCKDQESSPKSPQAKAESADIDYELSKEELFRYFIGGTRYAKTDPVRAVKYYQVAAAGGYANTKKAAGWLHSAMDITGTVWLSGVHSVSGGSAAYRFAPYGGEAMTNASGVGNITITGTGMSTASDDSSGGSVDVYPQGSSGTLTIDTSRYTNFNQIPGLMVGLDMNSANSCDSTDGSTIQYLNFGSKQLYALSGVAANTLGGQRLFVSDNTDPDKDIDVAIDTSVPSIDIVGHLYGYKSSRHDRVAGTVKLNLNYVNKASLRQQYNNAIGNAYQREWFENSADYDDFMKTLKETALVLGNPTATQAAVTNATNSIMSKNADVKLKKGSATVNYVDAKSGAVVETATSEFTITDTIVFSADELEGYNYNNTWECVVDSTVAKTGTDSFASIMTTFESCTFNFYYIPNTYAVTLNSWDIDYSPIGGTGNVAT